MLVEKIKLIPPTIQKFGTRNVNVSILNTYTLGEALGIKPKDLL